MHHHTHHKTQENCKDDVLIRSTVLKNSLASFFLSIVQIVSGFYTHSSGLIADGLHTISDVLCDFIVFFTSYFSRKEADEDHQYGHYRYENAASFFIGLISLGAGIYVATMGFNRITSEAGYQKIEKAALLIGVITIIVKELLFRHMLSAGEKIGSPMLIANAWHTRSDAFSSLVVTIGISGNLLGYTFLDPLAGMIVGLMICKIGLSLSYESFNDLTDKAVSPEFYEKVKTIINETPGVLGCHDLKTRKTGSMILVDVHIEVDGSATVKEGHEISVEARRRVRKELPVLNVMTHLDPIDIPHAQEKTNNT